MLSEIFELRVGIFLVLNAQTGGWEKAWAFRSTWVGGAPSLLTGGGVTSTALLGGSPFC